MPAAVLLQQIVNCFPVKQTDLISCCGPPVTRDRVRGAAAGLWRDVTDEEVSVFTRKTTARNPLYQHCCWLVVIKNNCKNNTQPELHAQRTQLTKATIRGRVGLIMQ